MSKKLFVLFFAMFLLVGTFGFVSAEKWWNFNNHTVNISDDLYVGGSIYGDASGLTGLPAGGHWNVSGSNMFPEDLNYNVGIGTDNPGAPLHVVGNFYNSGGYTFTDGFRGYSYGGGMDFSSVGPEFYTASNDYMTFATSPGGVSTERIRITSEGDVGIGTDSPQQELHVNGSLQLTDNVVSPDSITFDSETSVGMRLTNPNGYISLTPMNTGWAHIYTDRPRFIFSDDMYVIGGKFASYSTADLTLSAGGDSNDLVIDDVSGNVGIGTSGSSYKLDVSGVVNAHDFLINGSSISSSIGGSDVWNKSGTNVFPADLGDSVGIGTASPGEKLEVSGGNFLVDGVRNLLFDSSGGSVSLYEDVDGSGWAMNYGFLTQEGGIDVGGFGAYGASDLSGSGSLNYFFIGKTYNDNHMVIENSTGNVGIGMTNPNYKLDVSGNVRAQNNLYVGTGGGYFYSDSGSRIRTNQDFYANNANTYLYANNLYLGNSAGDNVRVRDNEMYGDDWVINYNEAGNWGIGTTIPDVGADLHIKDPDHATIVLEPDSGHKWAFFAAGTGATNENGISFYDYTNSEYPFIIDSQGFVGINGVTDPQQALHVSGSVAANQYCDGPGTTCYSLADLYGGGSTGDITGVTAGTDLDGGGTSGDVTLSLETTLDSVNRINGVTNINSGTDAVSPKIVLDSTSGGDNWPDQGAYVALGEQASSLGSAAMYMTYVGNGYGYVGSGALGADGIPDNTYLRFHYNSNEIYTPDNLYAGTLDTGSGNKELGDAAISDGDTNSIPTNDQVYDFVTSQISGGGIVDADTLDNLDSTDFMRSHSANGYDGLRGPNSGTSGWIRTTTNGIIPYQSGGASNLGTSSWPFSTVYSNNFYEGGTLIDSKYARRNSDDTIYGSWLWPGDQDYDGLYWGAQYKDASGHAGTWAYVRQGTGAGQLEFGSDNLFSFYETDGRSLAFEIAANSGDTMVGGDLTVNGGDIYGGGGNVVIHIG